MRTLEHRGSAHPPTLPGARRDPQRPHAPRPPEPRRPPFARLLTGPHASTSWPQGCPGAHPQGCPGAHAQGCPGRGPGPAPVPPGAQVKRTPGRGPGRTPGRGRPPGRPPLETCRPGAPGRGPGPLIWHPLETGRPGAHAQGEPEPQAQAEGVPPRCRLLGTARPLRFAPWRRPGTAPPLAPHPRPPWHGPGETVSPPGPGPGGVPPKCRPPVDCLSLLVDC